MAEITHKNLSLCLVQDAESGLAHVCVDVDGHLIPVATEKLGTITDALASPDDGTHLGIRTKVEAAANGKGK
jgi:hypothetical protein